MCSEVLGHEIGQVSREMHEPGDVDRPVRLNPVDVAVRRFDTAPSDAEYSDVRSELLVYMTDCGMAPNRKPAFDNQALVDRDLSRTELRSRMRERFVDVV